MKRYGFMVTAIFLLLLWCVTPFSVSAEGGVEISDVIESRLESASVSSVQDWLDGELTEKAGQSSEWYVFSLAQSGTAYDFTSYREALATYVYEHTTTVVTRQKYALLLAATGSTDRYISSVMDETIGEQGIMSYVYGLHLLSNGYQSRNTTVDEVKTALLNLQLPDGGWALSGDTADTDVTAMTVQALAPYYESDGCVKEAVDRALILLSSRQTENGDCTGFGNPCAESTAQMIVALSALGIDCQTDERFIKNGYTLFDGIERYRLENGGYCHVTGTQESHPATAQVLYAFVAYERMQSGKGSLYTLDHCRLDLDKEATLATTIVATASTTATVTQTSVSATDYKPMVTVIVVTVGSAIALLLIFLKKRHPKNLIAVAVLTAVAVAVVWLTTFQSADEYYGTPPDTSSSIGTVTLSIDCSAIDPQNGTILSAVSVPLEKDDTVYDVLVKAAREQSLLLDVQNGYVAAIDQVREFDHGDLSGWIYFVNGEKASVGCTDYTLADGDVIEWRYTCDMGQDIL